MNKHSSVAPQALLRSMFDAAVASALPERSLAPHLPEPPKGKTIVVGAGKAAAAMARALEAHWPAPLEGLVITRYGHAVPCQRIEVVEASHPVPDDKGRSATSRMLEMVKGLSADDLVIALISGGGSSLLVAPGEGISLEDKKNLNAALLQSGASISEMNCVRRHVSSVKGGRLAAACYPARVLTLLISDVPGDSPVDIASGPTVADPTTRLDALEILERYRIKVPESIVGYLERDDAESIRPEDRRLAAATIRTIITPQASLEAAAEVARNAGYTPYILGDSLEGEARDLGRAMAGITRQVVLRGQPFKAPCVLLSGGETTVTIKGNGRGGRNTEFLLSLAIALDGLPGVHALAADTDGVDGAEEIAGASISPDTLTRAWAADINPRISLDNNDGHGFFGALGDSVVTGPTMTNVNDFRAILIAG